MNKKMPADNPIVNHWHAELEVFAKNLASLREQLTPDPIHDLRVAIKKLRSYFRLGVALYGKEGDGGQMKETAELFAVLGRHRNIEISRQLLLSFAGENKEPLNPVLLYFQLLQDQVAAYCRDSVRQYEEHQLESMTQELETLTASSTAEETQNNARALIFSRLEKVKHDLRHFADRSHLVRKELKDIFYWLKIFEADAILHKQQTKNIDKILEHLGNVQDHEVMLSNLKGFRKTIISKGAPGYELVKKIEQKAEKKQEAFLDKAHKLTVKLTEDIKSGHVEEKEANAADAG